MTEANSKGTSNASVLRILALSDLHAVRDTASKESHLVMTPSSNTPNGDPFTTAVELIRREQITADVVLCPGDLGNRADPLAIAFAWDKVQQLALAVGARHCIAASGNHDVDSRLQSNTYDPTECLKGLQPRYPVANENEYHRYWSLHFAAVEDSEFRIITLNSAAFHWIEGERERGRVSVATIDALKQYLSRSPARLVNILLCHHHPHRHPELRIANSSVDVMIDGNLLIDMLAAGHFGDWLVIHGHKHHPYLSYASGQIVAPIVLSCGSFSAALYKELQTEVRNQLYVVEIPLGHVSTLGLVGRVRAWDWSYSYGWVEPSGRMLPAISPFGARESPSVYAASIDRLVPAAAYVLWEELTAQIPMLAYLPPDKATAVFAMLRAKYGLTVTLDGQQPVQVSRAVT